MPLGVTVHVNDEDGDVNIDTPTSLQVIHLLPTSNLFPNSYAENCSFSALWMLIHEYLYSGGWIIILFFLMKTNLLNAHSYQGRQYLFPVGGGIAFLIWRLQLLLPRIL